MCDEQNKVLQEVAQEYRVDFLEKNSDRWKSGTLTFDSREEATQHAIDVVNAELTMFVEYQVVPATEPVDQLVF